MLAPTSSTMRPSNRWIGALGVPRITRIVRHHADRGAAAMQFAQQIHHASPFSESRFPVGSSASRMGLAGQRARDSDALLLTAGELRG